MATAGSFNLDLYEKETCIGRGTFGTVFRWKLKEDTNAENLPLWIAVKEIIPPDITQGSPVGAEKRTHKEREESVHREHKLLQKYPHENSVKYFGRVDDKHLNVIHFVMELCITDLKHFRKGRISLLPEVAIIMKQVITALAYLHENSIIHSKLKTLVFYMGKSKVSTFLRDIKPGNILVKTNHAYSDLKSVHVSNLTFVLGDFGLARYIYNNNNTTMTLTTVGTMEYAPPEVHDCIRDKNGTAHYEASFDIYSAGVVTHELITGKLHQEVTTYTDVQELQRSLGLNCDSNLLDFLTSMLHQNKRNRKTSMELISHPFLEEGETFNQSEIKRQELLRSLKCQNKRLSNEVKKTQANNDALRTELILQNEINDSLRQEKTWSKGTTSVNDLLWEAAKIDNVNTMKIVLRKGAHLEHRKDSVYAFGPSTSLHVAALKGNLAATKLLINEGANVNAPTGEDQTTPLMLASMKGHHDIARALISSGAKVDARKCDDGFTALHMAAYWSHFDICKLLVEDGIAKVNARDDDGKTPLAKAEEPKLSWVKEEDRDAVIEYLKQNGAKS